MITEEKYAYRKLFFRDHARRTLWHMVWPFRNRGMVERTCLQCGQIWVLKVALAGRRPPKVPGFSVAPDLRYMERTSAMTKAGIDQFLAATRVNDAAAEDKDSQLFRELQVCPNCKGSRYSQRRIRRHGDSALLHPRS